MSELVHGYPVEILSIIPGKSLGVPMALVEVRPQPEYSLESLLFFFNREQCIRLRNTLHRYLCDTESWLYMPDEEQVEIAVDDE